MKRLETRNLETKSKSNGRRGYGGQAAARVRSGMRPPQLTLLPKLKDVFVGAKRGTHAKTDRPLDSRKPIHVCFRSQYARGKQSMLGINKLKVKGIVDGVSKRFGINIVKFANVGNHLHLVVRLPGSAMTSRRQYSKWIRLLTSRLAFEIGGSKKGEPFRGEDGERTKFWDARPFTRVVHGRRGWSTISRYVLKNEFQAGGASEQAAIILAKELYESAGALNLPEWRSTA